MKGRLRRVSSLLGMEVESMELLAAKCGQSLKRSGPHDRLQGATDLRLSLGESRQGSEKLRRWNMTSTDGAGRLKVGLQSCRKWTSEWYIDEGEREPHERSLVRGGAGITSL